MKQGRFILVVGLVVLCVLWRQAQAQQVVYAITPRPPSCPAVSDYGSNGLNFCYDGTLYFWNGASWAQVVGGSGSVACSQLPALTGDVTSPAGSCVTTETAARGPAGGDLSGTYPNPTVAKILTATLDGSVAAPAKFALLEFEGDGVITAWEAFTPTTAAPNSDALINTSGAVSYYIYDLLNGQTGGITAKGAIPVTSDTVATDAATIIAAGAAGTTLNGNGAGSIPTFGSPPLIFRGGSNAVLPDNTNAYVFPFDGVGTPVQTTSEGTVLTIFSSTYNSKQIRCGLYNAAGVLTSPSPGTYTCAIRRGGVTQTGSNCVISSAATCNTVSLVSFATGNTGDYICTPASAPVALIPKCSSQGF